MTLRSIYWKIALLSTLAWLAMGSGAWAQELNARVEINTSEMRENNQVTEKQVFSEMKNAITQFLNTRKWTADNFKPEERINCYFEITINESPSVGQFIATARVQSSRPVYGTGYESVVLTFIDREFAFGYVQAQPLDFNENVFVNNLTSMLSFYAYLLVGLDYDTFSKLGGTPQLQRAYGIAQLAQQANERGWSASGDTRNRYYLIENLISQQLLPVREGMFTYYRTALDHFGADQDKARGQLVSVLEQIRAANQLRANSLLTNTFFDTKASELIAIFRQAAPADKQKAYNLLVELDPTKADRYRAITE